MPPSSERREAWQKCGVSRQLLPAEGGIARHQGSDARVSWSQQPGLAGRGVAGRARISGILPPGRKRARHRATRAFRGVTATTVSPIPRSASMAGRRLDGGLLSLSKIGRIPIRLHRPLKGTPKTVTISREADGWYVCISCADVPVQPLPATGQETGIDLGIEAFATLSDGTRIFHPGWYRKAERALKTAQRRVSRRKKGSNRRRKAVTLLAKAHQQVRRQRRDFHHKTALALVQAQRYNLSRRHYNRPTW